MRNQLLVFSLSLIVLSGTAIAGDVSVRDVGAAGDGRTLDTAAIQKALDAAAAGGGGVVRFPTGRYLAGSLVVKSHTTLHLDEGTILMGSSRPDDYPLVQARWEGRDAPCHRALISADHAEDIGVTGPGTIQGNPEVSRLRDPRGPAVVEPIECGNVRVEDVTLKSTRIWTLHPTYCHDVRILHVKFETTGGNGDGIDPDSCQRVLIDGCTFSTDDDNIAIKSGKGQEGARVGRPCEDITITNCVFTKGNSSICFGSELSGGIRKVRISNCTFKQGKGALMLKLRPSRGGYVQDVVAEHLVVGPEPLLVTDMSYQKLVDPQGIVGPGGHTRFGGIQIRDVQIDAKRLLNVQGFPDTPLDGLRVSDVHGTCSEGSTIQHAKGVDLAGIDLKGVAGPVYTINDVEGNGLEGAAHTSK